MSRQNDDLQLENGNYTRIVNKVLEELVKAPLLGVELAICIFVLRKTWGYNKKTDEISITQFEKGVKRSRPTIVKALKNLQLYNILQLVKVGNSKSQSSVWMFNKKYSEWQLGKTPQLVKDRSSTSKEKLLQLVNTPKHTKDNTKNNIQKKEARTPAHDARFFFKGISDLQEKIESEEAQATRQFLLLLESKYPHAPKTLLWSEIKKFYGYWTELNQSGTKERWQKQEAFQVDRRLVTWFSKIGQFGENNIKNKGKEIIV